jgi:large subunit ribosomal protein L3
MSLGLVGRKVGMTRVFAEDGSSVPVTVLDVSNNRVTQIKTPEVDGYAAVQVTFGKRRASRVSKPAAGHLRESWRRSRRSSQGIPCDTWINWPASSLVMCRCKHFSVGQKVDVSGTSIGKGYRRCDYAA